MKKIILCASALIVSSVFILVGINLSDVKTVSAVTLQKKIYTPHINVSGELVSTENVDIAMSYPLYIKDVYVKENSYINIGQALFSIDKVKMIEIINGQSEVDLTQYPMDTHMLKYLSEESNKSALSALPDIVYATDSGIVHRLNISPQSIVMPNQTLMSICNSDGIMARLSLSQIDYGRISIGDEVNITPVAFADISYSGVISESNAVIKKQSSINGTRVVVDVFASIDNPDQKLADGLQINGVVKTDKPYEITGIDYDYIFQDENGQYVMVFENGKAKKIYIETGVEIDSFTEILTPFEDNTVFINGDITEGDRVILDISI